MERGVVALPYEVIKADSGFKTGETLSALQVNYFALYWDKISVPKNNFIGATIPNEKLLEEAGVLDRPSFPVGNPIDVSEFPRFHLLTQLKVADQLRDSQKSTVWSIHQTGDKPLLLADGSVSKETVRLELENLLPVPDVNIELHEILEFKSRRAAELQALHSYCDELYFDVINSGDPRLQAARAFHKLKQAIEDLERLNREGFRSPIKFNLDISPEFDLSDCRAGIATILAAFNSPHVFETLTAGAIISVVEGFVKIRPRLQSMRKGGDMNLAYISNGKREGLYTKKS
nr:DUF6236 family protein [Enterobacter soli]